MRPASRLRGIPASPIQDILRKDGEEYINLCLGQPGFDTPDHVKEAAIDAIRRGDATTYTDNHGIPPLREAITGHVQGDVSPDEVLVTTGSSEALHLVFMAYAGPGDDIVLPEPAYLNYEAIARLTGADVTTVPLRPDGTLHPDDVAEAVSPSTTVILVNTPTNPTGAVQTEAEMRAFAEIADDTGAVLVSDEIYDKLTFEPDHHSALPHGDDVIVVNGVSKAYSMTGWRLGFLAGRDDLLAPMRTIHENTHICTTVASQHAALAAYTGPQDATRKMREAYRRRRDVLVDGFDRIGLDCVTPGGTFYIFPRVPDGFVDACEDRGLLILDGAGFGPAGEGYARLSYAGHDVDVLDSALDIMEDAHDAVT